MPIKHNEKGYCSWSTWNQAKFATLGMTIRQAASKAGMRATLCLEHVYLDEVKVRYGEAREIIGTRLINRGFTGAGTGA